MSQNISPHSPIRPLSVGNVVSSALVLYRSHFKSYLGVAFRATLWSLLPSFTQLLIGQLQGRIDPSVAVLIRLPWLALNIFCVAKASTNIALISRLAFGELISKPETVKSAGDNLNSRKWKFLWSAFLVGLLMVGAFIALYIAFLLSVLLVAGLSTFIGRIVTNSYPILALIVYLIAGLLYIAVFVGFFAGILWFVARFFISELPLAVETNVGITRTIGRSWELTKGAAFRIVLILSVAYLIVTPFIALALTPIALIFPSIPISSIASSPEEFLRSFSSLITVAILLITLANTFILPFWQTIKAVIYYDLRSRKEGLDLQLRDRPLEM
ncbi:DUF975 family protein [Argonema galeatum]|uniref:DUF975 family protein n=1 Tax=Argonema galeatum TaxID=2942762 RepID=UPI0020126CFE|nr:DUF975 family protein [Argonema galeatum]MCL1466624.1 DUF975 family protein [Argonema galeatum A003/A1]